MAVAATKVRDKKYPAPLSEDTPSNRVVESAIEAIGVISRADSNYVTVMYWQLGKALPLMHFWSDYGPGCFDEQSFMEKHAINATMKTRALHIATLYKTQEEASKRTLNQAIADWKEFLRKHGRVSAKTIVPKVRVKKMKDSLQEVKTLLENHADQFKDDAELVANLTAMAAMIDEVSALLAATAKSKSKRRDTSGAFYA